MAASAYSNIDFETHLLHQHGLQRSCPLSHASSKKEGADDSLSKPMDLVFKQSVFQSASELKEFDQLHEEIQ